MTKQRAAILQIIRHDGGHLSAAEIYEKAKVLLPSISLATVYNNLHAMEQEGLIRALHTDKDTVLYDKSGIPHVHTLCMGCGAFSDAPSEAIEQCLMHAMEQQKTPLLAYDVTLHILCERCKNQPV